MAIAVYHHQQIADYCGSGTPRRFRGPPNRVAPVAIAPTSLVHSTFAIYSRGIENWERRRVISSRRWATTLSGGRLEMGRVCARSERAVTYVSQVYAARLLKEIFNTSDQNLSLRIFRSSPLVIPDSQIPKAGAHRRAYFRASTSSGEKGSGTAK
jgi:hypothetical protein